MGIPAAEQHKPKWVYESAETGEATRIYYLNGGATGPNGKVRNRKRKEEKKNKRVAKKKGGPRPRGCPPAVAVGGTPLLRFSLFIRCVGKFVVY